MAHITVVMPAYNSEKYIGQAIESILNQTHGDFEFIIIDDCSTDNTLDVINNFQDKRIRLITRNVNSGLPKCINSVLKSISSPILARMDADDISSPTRFEKQIEFIKEFPRVGILGVSSRNLIECENGSYNTIATHPHSHEDIKSCTLFRPPIIHPTIMINFNAFNRELFFYDPSYVPSADYECWVRLLNQGVIFGNVKEYLFRYRHHRDQISTRKRKQQQLKGDLVRRMALGNIGIVPTNNELKLHKDIAFFNYDNLSKELAQVAEWFDYLLKKNAIAGYYCQRSLPMTLMVRIKFMRRNFRHDSGAVNMCNKIAAAMEKRIRTL